MIHGDGRGRGPWAWFVACNPALINPSSLLALAACLRSSLACAFTAIIGSAFTFTRFVARLLAARAPIVFEALHEGNAGSAPLKATPRCRTVLPCRRPTIR